MGGERLAIFKRRENNLLIDLLIADQAQTLWKSNWLTLIDPIAVCGPAFVTAGAHWGMKGAGMGEQHPGAVPTDFSLGCCCSARLCQQRINVFRGVGLPGVAVGEPVQLWFGQRMSGQAVPV